MITRKARQLILPMSTQDDFPLLRLPLLAREHVLRMMTPFELIDLSMTSSRVKRSVIFFSRIEPRFRVSLKFWFDPEIIIEGHREKWRYSWTSDRYWACPRTRYKFSDNQLVNCMNWYESMKRVIGCRIVSLQALRMDKLITDWLLSQQNSIENVNILDCCLKDVKYFLETIRVTGILDLEVNFRDRDCLFELPDGPYILLIKHSAFYIRYEELIRMKSPRIILRGSCLTNQDINQFLKSWMSMESHLNLEFFGINVSGPEAVNEIMNLPHEVTTDPNILTKFNNHPFYANVTRGFKIKRSDGKIATVCVEYKEIFGLPSVDSSCLIGL
uniref:F-box domain-containing protein n=1 Tax=Caenorhabditis tropicalis TaxID=1561998 RepID=A0A1I7TH96_9PELO